MSKEWLESLKKLFFISLSENEKAEFVLINHKINITRSKYTATAFIVMEVIMLAIYLFSRNHEFYNGSGKTYAWMYLIMILAMIGFLLIFIWLGQDVTKNGSRIFGMGVLFSSFILAWCAGISLLDQLTNGQVIVYVIAIIAIAVTPIFKPFALLTMYMIIHTLFLFFMPYFQSSSVLLFANSMNSTSFVIISWAICIMRYKKAIQDFKNKKILQQKSQELEEMNRELEEMNQKLETLSRTDALTRVCNRLMFDIKIEQEWNRCKHHMIALTLILVDIDHFKTYNDYYGHQAGDQCIIKVAQCLSNYSKNPTDMVCRYGGDEFVMVLPQLKKDKALALAEKIKAKVEEMNLPHMHSEVSHCITVSVGVHTMIPSDELSIQEFVRITDDALYKAKEKRNCICTA